MGIHLSKTILNPTIIPTRSVKSDCPGNNRERLHLLELLPVESASDDPDKGAEWMRLQDDQTGTGDDRVE